MSWLSSIFSGGASEVLKGVDSLFTSDAERLQWEAKKLEIEAKVAENLNALEAKLQEHLDSRHKADMQSDSWLSKNIRPLALIHFVVVLDVIIVLGYFGLILPAVLLGVVSAAVQLILGFYFGGRSLEKATKMLSGVFKK